MKNRFLINGSVAAAAAAIAVMPPIATAQDVSEPTQDVAALAADDSALDVVVVSGIRSSIEDAVDVKRNSNNFVDAISAQDIGKLPDQNVAESLQRISGVQIARSKGEGSEVSIRGLDPDLVLVTINGRRAPSSTSNSATFSTETRGRAFQFDQLSAELVSGLQVYKSPQASLIEGGVAGTINIDTPRPLDIGDFKASARLGGNYNALSEEWGPEIGGFVSNVFADGKVGIMVSGNYSERNIRQDFTDQPGYNFIDIDQDLNVLDAGQTTIPVDMLAFNDVFYPQSSRLFSFDEERERLGLAGTIQVKANEYLTITADSFYTNFEVSESSNYIEALGRSVSQFDSVSVNGNGTVDEYNAVGGFRTVGQLRDPEVETFILGLNAEYELDKWAGDFDISFSRNESSETRDLLLYTRNDSDFTISFNQGSPFSIDPGFDVSDANEFGANGLGLFRRQPLSGIDEELAVHFIASRFLDHAVLSSVDFGVRYTDASKEVDEDLVNFVFNNNDPSNAQIPLQDVAISGGLNGLGIDGLLSSGSANLPSNFAVPSISTFLGLSAVAGNITPGENPLADFVVEEKVFSGFVQANFGGDVGGLPFSGDFGLRIVNTEQTSSGFANVTLQLTGGDSTGGGLSGDGFTAVSEEQSYTDVLPSVNLNFDLGPDLKLRFAIAKVMSRPDLAQISPATSVNLSQNIASAGQPGLDPFRATQFDVAFERYIGSAGLVSVAYFQKDIESFVDFITTSEELFGTQLDVTRPVNGAGVTLRGIEFNYQQFYDFLPAPFDGLGMQFNYTYTDNDAEQLNELTGQSFGLVGSSENSFNIVGIYETDNFSGRLAYNYRDGFLQSVSGNRGNPEFVEDYGQLDLSMSYDINDTFAVSFDAINLTDSVLEKFSFIPERPFEYEETGRRFLVGLRASF